MRYPLLMIVAAIWYRVLGRLGYHRRIFVVRELEVPTEGPNTDAEFTVRELLDEDSTAFVQLRDGPGEDLFLRRRSSGDRCFAALHGDKIVSVFWFAVNSAVIMRLRSEFDIDPGDVYIYDAYTDPRFRGSGLIIRIYENLCREYVARGYRRATMLLLPEASVGRTRRGYLGFSVHGEVRGFRIGRWAHFRSSGEAPILRPHRTTE